MKRQIYLLFLVFFQLSAFSAETVEQRLVKLERIVKAQSDSISTYKAKVAEIDLQRSFLSDIYNGNSTWFIGLVSLIVVLIVGYSVISNKFELNKMTKKINKSIKSIDEINLKYKNNIQILFNEKIETHTHKFDLLNAKINDALITMFQTNSMYYADLSTKISPLNVKEKFVATLIAAKNIIMYNGFANFSDYTLLESTFSRIIEIYKSTTVNEQHEFIKKTYIDELFKIDISSFNVEYQTYLTSKIKEILIKLE